MEAVHEQAQSGGDLGSDRSEPSRRCDKNGEPMAPCCDDVRALIIRELGGFGGSDERA